MLGFQSTVALSLEETHRLRQELEKRSGTTAQLGQLLRDPIVFKRLAGLPIVSKAKNLSPRPAIEAVKSLLLGGSGKAKRPGGGPARPQERPIQLLAESDAIFQARKTRVSIAKAERLLGYRPIYDLSKGMARTREWAAWANLLG